MPSVHGDSSGLFSGKECVIPKHSHAAQISLILLLSVRVLSLEDFQGADSSL